MLHDLCVLYYIILYFMVLYSHVYLSDLTYPKVDWCVVYCSVVEI